MDKLFLFWHTIMRDGGGWIEIFLKNIVGRKGRCGEQVNKISILIVHTKLGIRKWSVNDCYNQNYFCLFSEHRYELRQLYKRRLSLRQHLLELQLEKEKVTYLDGKHRGKPPKQWDATVEKARIRNLRSINSVAKKYLASNGDNSSSEGSSTENLGKEPENHKSMRRKMISSSTKSDRQAHLLIPDNLRDRLSKWGLSAYASESDLHTAADEERSHLPDIHVNQKVTASQSEELLHSGNNPTLNELKREKDISSYRIRQMRRKSRSLSDLSAFYSIYSSSSSDSANSSTETL